jgi:hypothetical protein
MSLQPILQRYAFLAVCTLSAHTEILTAFGREGSPTVPSNSASRRPWN